MIDPQVASTSIDAQFRLIVTKAFDGSKSHIGYRYQIFIPESLCGIEGGNKETLYESYLYNSPLNREIHDSEAEKAYNNKITTLRERAELRGWQSTIVERMGYKSSRVSEGKTNWASSVDIDRSEEKKEGSVSRS